MADHEFDEPAGRGSGADEGNDVRSDDSGHLVRLRISGVSAYLVYAQGDPRRGGVVDPAAVEFNSELSLKNRNSMI